MLVCEFGQHKINFYGSGFKSLWECEKEFKTSGGNYVT